MSENLVKVQTQYGPINGCVKTSVLGRDYFNFQAIPYMKQPVGKLRFVDPQPPEEWKEPLDCTKEGPPFPNMFFLSNQYQGELNGGVHINVYTNNINPSTPYPVLVWIHGGGVFTGNASEAFTGPDYFMQKDVVLVTFQYRIGVFGFLSLEDPSLNIPGNAQFRDHIMALQWVQKNIANFGGNPESVTLSGESWGGGSTGYHMLFEQSKGLFHRGILMSGSALNSVYSIMPRRNWALRLCLILGYSGPHDDKHILEFLETADETELVIASGKVMTERERNEEFFMFAFGPTIESYDNGNALITHEIVEMSKNSWGNGIDILIGNTSNECVNFTAMIKTQEAYETFKSFQKHVSRELDLDLDSPKRLEYADRLKRHYYGGLEPSLASLNGIIQAHNDNCLWHPMSRIIRARLQSGRAKTFSYRFDYVTENNLWREFFKVDKQIEGACHGDDVSYIFKTKGLEGENFKLPIDSLAFKGICLMTSMFVNFATTGNPNVDGLKDVEWKEATKEEPLMGLNINEKTSKMMNLPELERVKIYDDFFQEQGKTLF